MAGFHIWHSTFLEHLGMSLGGGMSLGPSVLLPCYALWKVLPQTIHHAEYYAGNQLA